jgi:two-component system, NarL family, nitrate/nitrite response regulator NarL
MEAREPRAARALRVAVIATDPVRRAGLVAIVTGAGHEIVDTVDRADVVLADAVDVEAGDAAVVSLGSADSGQAGSLPRDAWPAQIDAALRGAAAGLIVRSAVLPRPVFDTYPSEDVPLLTPREIEVLAAIGDGLSNKEVARRFGISPHTVKFHVEALFDKLDVTSRAEAVHKGLKRGLIDL